MNRKSSCLFDVLALIQIINTAIAIGFSGFFVFFCNRSLLSPQSAKASTIYPDYVWCVNADISWKIFLQNPESILQLISWKYYLQFERKSSRTPMIFLLYCTSQKVTWNVELNKQTVVLCGHTKARILIFLLRWFIHDIGIQQCSARKSWGKFILRKLLFVALLKMQRGICSQHGQFQFTWMFILLFYDFQVPGRLKWKFWMFNY